MPVATELLKAAKKWKAQDPDPTTKAELTDLINRAESGDEAAAAELTEAFTGWLEFGTAGIRGRLGPGPGRMNEVVVHYLAEAVGAHLRQKASFGPILIGYDGRHKSADFARISAEVLGGNNFRPIVFTHPVPTPLVAFGVRELECMAGIVVTASHNPAEENGYKVFGSDGRQIIGPTDERITEGMVRVSKRPLFMMQKSGDYRRLGDEIITAYLDRIARVAGGPGPRKIRWVHTALHGVAGAMAQQVAERLGFPAPIVVAEQHEPDPDFPTVPLPNPEEPGAFDLALKLARAEEADLVIANDPDGDRCAVAIPADVDGGWRILHGDELGALLGDFMARRGARGTFANSIASGSMLSRIAAAHDQPQVTTLTGFKWISRVEDLAYGYEEAQGYCCDPKAVLDKDGLSALAYVLTLAAEEKAAGRTLADRLDRLATEHGVHLNEPLTVRVNDVGLIQSVMERIRTQPPEELCGEPVEFVDLADGLGELPPTDAVRLLGETVTVTVRPSGTEPKLKCYLETRVSPELTQRDLAGSRAEARGMMDRLQDEVQTALGL
jgi:phosphomannomutase